METPAPPLRLHLLNGLEAPPDLAADLRRLARFPAEALVKFWQALGPCLQENLSEDTERLLDVFCSAYGIEGDDLARTIKACRFVIQSAARLDVPGEAFGEDLGNLCPDAPVVKEVLLAGYDRARAQLRQEIIEAMLLDHGKLLAGARYRLDTIDSSERGARFRFPVAMLTLEYREGAEMKRITLQVLPDMMATLKGICERVLS